MNTNINIRHTEEVYQKPFNELERGDFFLYEGRLFQKAWSKSPACVNHQPIPIIEGGVRIDTGEIIVFKGVEPVICLPDIKIIF